MGIYLRYILVLVVQSCMSQVIRQQSFSGSGTSLAYSFYFNVYQSQSVTLSFSTNCPHLQIAWINSGGSTLCSTCGNGYGNGGTYSASCNLGVGTGQKLLFEEWSGRSSCNWWFSFRLNFSCSVVTSNCFDCSGYTICTSCITNYYLFNNRCYAFPSYCLSVSGTSCTACSSGYLLMSGVCQSCAALIFNCVTCTSTSVCTSCKTGYALTPANQCELCSFFMSNCQACSNNNTCTGCISGYALKNATTCQSCSTTLTNCLTCSSVTQCTSCSVVGYAVATVGGCSPCSTFKSNCVLCSSNSTCTQCLNRYSAEPTGCVLCTTVISYCLICNFAAGPSCLKCQIGFGLDTSTPASDCTTCSVISQCIQCLDDQNCTKCAPGFTVYFNATSARYICRPCSNFISQCITCFHQSSCATCVSPYTVASSGQCLLCSQVLSGCNTCSDSFACTTCTTGYGLNSNNQCTQCSSVMKNCIKCTTISNCIQCTSGYLPSAGTCKACSIFLPDCFNCTNQTTCTGCDFGYALDSTLSCKFCSILIPYCSYCIDNATCHTCQPGYVLFNGLCVTCDVVFSNCNTCVNNISCSVCDRSYAVVLGRCITCLKLINHCQNCFDSVACEDCYDPYVTDNNSKCKCKSPLYNVSDLCIDDRQCVNAYKQNDTVLCSFCNISTLYILNQDKKCVCITGYEQVNFVCKQKCGDGHIIKHACDDNNTQDGDGCSSTCSIEPDFVCSIVSSGISQCKIFKDLQLKFDSVWKILPENKGLIYISLKSTDPRLIKFYASSRFKFTVSSNRTGTIIILNCSRNSDGQIVIQIQYNQTIESSMIELTFKFDKDSITSNDDFLKFNLKGSNYPLVISAYNEYYEQLSKVQFYFVLCFYALMLLVLFSDKFIGVEALNTLQLTYFSMLLIYNNDTWPLSFSTLLPLHYSTGFSRIFYQQLNYLNSNILTFSKYQYLGICEYFFLNNFTNFVILFVVFIIFLILFLIKTKKENQICEMNDCPMKRRLRRDLGKFRKIYRKIYNFTFNFCYTMILQVFISLYIETSYMKQISTWMKVGNKFAAIWTFTVMVITILQNYNHFFLSQQETIVEKYDVGSREMKYKRVYFIYILFNTWFIIMLNNKLVLGYPLSGILLIASLIYLAYLLIYRPYKHSFLIHGVTIIINHLMFMCILAMVTLINLELKLDEFYFLILSYTLMGFTFIIMFLTVVRVIIDFKYDANNVTQQIKIQVENNRKVEERLFAQQITKQITQKEKPQKEKLQKDTQNNYLYNNQKIQAEQIDFLVQLKKKFFLSQWQRDQAYYRVYEKKPIKWVQQNDNEDKFKLLMEKERERFEGDLETKQMTKLKKQKILDKTYADQVLNIKERLRGQYTARKEKNVLKKQVKRSKNKKQTAKYEPNQI